MLGNQTNGGNAPETNENFFIQTLDMNGNTLTTYTIFTGGFPYPRGLNWTYYSRTSIANEKINGYYIRWFQNLGTTGKNDHYALTDITINYTVDGLQLVNADVSLDYLPTTQPSEPNRV